MRFLCDVHIPLRLSNYLNACGHHAEHVNAMPNRWHTDDAEIRSYADAHDLTVISKDKDFRNSYLITQSPRKFIRVCLGNLSNDMLVSIFERTLPVLERLDAESLSYMVEVYPDALMVTASK
jgi:predicted nuclease of predicted toxin-antitoxin system